MKNSDIAKILFETSVLYKMQDDDYKARAYEKASQSIDNLEEQVEVIYSEKGSKGLLEISDVGEAIAEHIADTIESGNFEEHKNLKKKIPVDIIDLIDIEGVGPKNIKTLWEELEIRNIDDLEEAGKKKKIRKLEGFGEKMEEKILDGIKLLKESGGRKILGFIISDVRKLEEKVRKIPGVESVVIAGSIRRMKETVGDVDILVVAKKPKNIMEEFVKFPEISSVIAKGEKKTTVSLDIGMNADLRVFSKDEFGAALNYFTGSQAHNVKLRKIAKEKGYKLNEYGLFKDDKKIAGKTEEEIYEKLGLRYVEPELREDQGEVEAALRQVQGESDGLPVLVGYSDLKGDLQIQTDWTDGKHSIMEMAERAMGMGLEYIVITDHTKDLSVTNGADEEKLEKQMKEIDRLNEELKSKKRKFKILKGAEVNIMKDGSLDINDETLAKLDVVGAAIHKHFELSEKEQTQRIIRAMENPHVDIIFHLTTRVISKRRGIEIDVDEIFKAAKKTKTVIEIDAFADRLDINQQYIRKCVRMGIKMSIDSDAHDKSHLDFLEIGIAQARRGWAEKKDIINAYPAEEMLLMLKKGE